jgi:hypothetical protein
MTSVRKIIQLVKGGLIKEDIFNLVLKQKKIEIHIICIHSGRKNGAFGK